MSDPIRLFGSLAELMSREIRIKSASYNSRFKKGLDSKGFEYSRPFEDRYSLLRPRPNKSLYCVGTFGLKWIVSLDETSLRLSSSLWVRQEAWVHEDEYQIDVDRMKQQLEAVIHTIGTDVPLHESVVPIPYTYGGYVLRNGYCFASEAEKQFETGVHTKNDPSVVVFLKTNK